MSKYSHIDFKPPKSVQDEMKQALAIDLKLRGKGLESATVSMATKISKGGTISPEQARKGYRFWSRNERFLSEPKDSPAWVAAKFWAGRSGMSWYRKLYKQIEAADKEGKQNMKNVRVNIHTAINADKVTIERSNKDGDEYTTIKNHKWMIDEIVLNGGLYSKEHNEKGYKSMEGRLFPAGHPTVNGQYVTISNQDNPVSNEALAKHYIGASTRNIRKVGNAYYEDIEVNNRLAMANEDGKALLNWCEAVENYQANGGEAPIGIHTSTGLLCNQGEGKGESLGKEYDWIAVNQNYDHNALLVNEIGAGGDEISLNVNGDQIRTITVNLDDEMDDDDEDDDDKMEDMDKEEVGLFRRFMAFIAKSSDNGVKSNTNTNSIEVDPMKEKMIAALNAAGIATEGLSDDQLFDKHSQLLSTNATKNALTAEDVAKIVSETLATNKQNEEKAAKESLVAEVIANSEYKEEDKEMLLNTDERILKSFLPKPSAATLGRPHANSQSDTSIINDTMPE